MARLKLNTLLLEVAGAVVLVLQEITMVGVAELAVSVLEPVLLLHQLLNTQLLLVEAVLEQQMAQILFSAP